MTFKSTKVETIDANKVRITAATSALHGITKPVVLEATFNGGYAVIRGPASRIGFSAHGTLNRSEFGIAYGIPERVRRWASADRVEMRHRAEFTGPPLVVKRSKLQRLS